MHTYLRRLTDERDSLTQTATAITEQAAQENRDVTDTERASLGTMSTRCAEIDEQLRTYGQQLESSRAYAQLRSALGDDEPPPAPRELGNRSTPQSQAVRWGEVFIESAAFRSYDGHGSSGRVDLPLRIEERAPIDTASIWNTSNPYLYVPPLPTISTPLIDAVTPVTTGGNTVSVMTMPGAYPLAAVVAEGALKPEADFVPTEYAATLHTLAHWKPITRQALEDIPQIQSIVETQLRGGISSAINQEIGAALAATALTVVGNTVDLATIRQAVGTVQAVGFPGANAVLLNPMDWAALDIDVMNSTSNGPNSAGNFWGLRPLADASVPEGTAYVGDFKAGVTLFNRGSASVYLTDSHADYFVRNILVVLAEARALAVVTQGAALVKIAPGTGGAGAATASGARSAK